MAKLLWTQREDIGAKGRVNHRLAWQDDRKRTLLFGGESQGVPLGDTWEWDGESWTQVEDIGPAPRAGHGLAYDFTLKRALLFGGKGKALLGDTWEWNGETWTQVEDTGPTARHQHALVYDRSRKRIVLFGGESSGGELLGDTWEWDGTAWTKVEDIGPEARAGHAMTFDTLRGCSVLFGGHSSTTLADTWEWDGVTWKQAEDVGPAACEGSALVFVGGSSILFGGVDSTVAPPVSFGVTWEWDGEHWTERQDIGPAARFGHGLAYDDGRNRAVLFGGLATSLGNPPEFADTWELPISSEPPPPPNPKLVLFDVNPKAIYQGGSTELTVGLDQPAASSVLVQVSMENDPLTSIPIQAGESVGKKTQKITGPMFKTNVTLTAKLGADALSFDLTVFW